MPPSPTPAPAVDLFGAALELPAKEREAFLAMRCGADAELRAEVQALLEAHDDVGDFMADDVPASPELERQFARLLPEVEIPADGDQLAWLAARALTPREEPAISLAHLHAPAVSVREQAEVIVGRLRRLGTATFPTLVADAGERTVVVARFLALLELAREQAVSFEQLTPLGELTIRWTGTADGELAISAEFDETDAAASGI